MATAPNTGLTYQNANSLRTDELYAELLNYLDAWLNCSVLAVGQAAPTGDEVDGDRYIVGTGTGLFADQNGKLAIKFGGVWFFFAPPAAGVPIVKNLTDGTDWERVAGVWVEKAGGGGGSGSLAGLSDVDTGGVSDGDALVWDDATSKWVPGASGGGSGGVANKVTMGYILPAGNLVPPMTSDTAPAGVVSASSSYSLTPAWGAFNGTIEVGWLNNSGLPAWIAYEAVAPVTVKSYAISPWCYDNYPGRWLVAWKLQGSDNGITWVDIDSRTLRGPSAWIFYGYRFFSCASNSTAYLHHRLYIITNGGDGYVGLDELALYATDITKA